METEKTFLIEMIRTDSLASLVECHGTLALLLGTFVHFYFSYLSNIQIEMTCLFESEYMDCSNLKHRWEGPYTVMSWSPNRLMSPQEDPTVGCRIAQVFTSKNLFLVRLSLS